MDVDLPVNPLVRRQLAVPTSDVAYIFEDRVVLRRSRHEFVQIPPPMHHAVSLPGGTETAPMLTRAERARRTAAS